MLAINGGQCSQRKASSYFRVHRSTLRHHPKFPSVKKKKIDDAIVDLSIEHPELVSDKVGRLVRNRGLRVSSERVSKLRREESLQVPPPKKKQSRRSISTGCFPKKATRRGHVWTWDFIHDTTIKGGSYRVLSVVDEYTREVHALQVARNIGSGKVREVMMDLIGRHGAPGYIRSDNVACLSQSRCRRDWPMRVSKPSTSIPVVRGRTDTSKVFTISSSRYASYNLNPESKSRP